VVGLRPSAGRVTRGTSNNLFAPLSVQGPMARTVADVALFLDAMVGLCPRDPLTFEAPHTSFASAVANSAMPKRVAFTADFAGKVPVDRETRDICAKAVRKFQDLGAVVDEASPDLGNIGEAFLALRSQHYVVDRELMLQTHRHLIKPDIVWNTETGLGQTPSQIAAAERERAALFRRTAEFFATYDLLVTPGASTPAFDVELRMPAAIDGRKLETYLGASLITAATTMMGLPSVAVPCGFDQYGRPVGLQLVGRHRGEAALLQAAVLFEQAAGLSRLLPIDPRPGTVPPG
jgi:amidase